MSNNKENEILFRMETLSKIEPSEKASKDAIEKVRNELLKNQKQKEESGTKILSMIFIIKMMKFTAAAVVLLATGFIIGRLAAPAQPNINMEEIQLLVDKKCADMAEKTLAAASTLMDQRTNEVVGLIEAARQNDRQWVAAAFEKIETDRRADTKRLGNSLVVLAARTSEMQSYKQN